jgi:hypothetical protein
LFTLDGLSFQDQYPNILKVPGSIPAVATDIKNKKSVVTNANLSPDDGSISNSRNVVCIRHNTDNIRHNNEV